MCILSFLPENTPVDVEALRNGGLSNPDGHGWAIVTVDQDDKPTILVGKSLDLETAISEFVAAREEHPGGPALFHSRWATHGSVSVENVHPFPVGGSPLTVMAHNGVLPAAAHPGKGDDRSDTRLFADEILCTRYRRLDKQRAFDALSNFCGTGNKLVILTVDPRYKKNAYLVNPGLGQWDSSSGIWHSNGAYLTKPARSYGSYSSYFGHGWSSQGRRLTTVGRRYGRTGSAAKSAEVFESYADCAICGIGLIDDYDVCTACNSCEVCCEYVDDCRCYEDELERAEQAAADQQAAADVFTYWESGESLNDYLDRVRAIREEANRAAERVEPIALEPAFSDRPKQPSINGMTDAEWEALHYDH